MNLEKFKGEWIALVTPFNEKGEFDEKTFRQIIEFQKNYGINFVPVGTTGESPTQGWVLHDLVISKAINYANKSGSLVMAGTGSNNAEEAIRGSLHAIESGAHGLLLVDPYYNKPPTFNIRKGYYEKIANNVIKENPNVLLTPYVIPGRTMAELSVEDLCLLNKKHENFGAVKEATGNLERMAKTRKLMGDDFLIFSGDDGLTYEMLTREDIKANGEISVMIHLVPEQKKKIFDLIQQKKFEDAKTIDDEIRPLYDVVTIKTKESYGGFENIPQIYSNPIPIKTALAALGVTSMSLRPPLVGMGPNGIDVLREKIAEAYENNPKNFRPFEEWFKVNLEERLCTDKYWNDLVVKMD